MVSLDWKLVGRRGSDRNKGRNLAFINLKTTHNWKNVGSFLIIKCDGDQKSQFDLIANCRGVGADLVSEALE